MTEQKTEQKTEQTEGPTVLADVIGETIVALLDKEFNKPPAGMDEPTHMLHVFTGLLLALRSTFNPDAKDKPHSFMLLRLAVELVLTEVSTVIFVRDQFPEDPASAEAFRD